MKYLELFTDITHMGELPSHGLCCISIPGGGLLTSDRIFDRFKPTYDDIQLLISKGMETGYWASESKYKERWTAKHRHKTMYKFTGLRQTILLFCAAINKEL